MIPYEQKPVQERISFVEYLGKNVPGDANYSVANKLYKLSHVRAVSYTHLVRQLSSNAE